MIIVDVTAYKIWSNNSHLSFSKRKIQLCVIVKSNLHSPISNLNFHFYEIFSASKLCMCKRCFDMLLIDSFYTIERITVICKRIFFCLAHISHLPILIQLKEVRTVWPMNEPYFNWGHFYVNWNIPTTNSQPVTSDLQLLFWKVMAWSQKRKRILNAGKYFRVVQNYGLVSKAKGFKLKCNLYANILCSVLAQCQCSCKLKIKATLLLAVPKCICMKSRCDGQGALRQVSVHLRISIIINKCSFCCEL